MFTYLKWLQRHVFLPYIMGDKHYVRGSVVRSHISIKNSHSQPFHTDTQIHTHTHIYIYIYIYHVMLLARLSLILTLSLSLSLSLFLSLSPIAQEGLPDYILHQHRPDVSSCRSTNNGRSMRRSPKENVTNDFILAFPAVSHISCFVCLSVCLSVIYIYIYIYIYILLQCWLSLIPFVGLWRTKGDIICRVLNIWNSAIR